jgi:hypothetical protein
LLPLVFPVLHLHFVCSLVLSPSSFRLRCRSSTKSLARSPALIFPLLASHAPLSWLASLPYSRSVHSPRSYEIERQIHGVKAKYNDIQMLDHQMMLPFFVGRKTVRFLWDRDYLPLSDAQSLSTRLLPLSAFLPLLSSRTLFARSPRSQKTPHASYEVHTPAELDTLLNDPEFNVPDRIRLIEIFMPR